jgi:hypothetical protein
MNLRDEPPPATDPDDTKHFPTRGWQCLTWAMEVLGILFLMGGIIPLTGALCLLALSGVSWDVEGFGYGLLFLAWVSTPVISGFLLLWAAARLEKPVRESGTFLVLVAASTFAGLAWAAMTAVLLFSLELP